MSDFADTRLLLHASLESALKNGRSSYGFTTYDLSDEDVQAVPQELRHELAIWVDAATGRDGPGPEPLEVDTPDTTIGNIITALRREAAARRERAIRDWQFKSEDDYLDFRGEPVAAVAALLGDERIALELKDHQEARAERKKHGVAADDGLRSYALSIPELARAAREKYDVRVAALDHYVRAIASFDEDALTYRAGTPDLDNAKFEERRAPNSHAFSVLDALAKHVEQLPKPDAVKTTISRVQRFRRAVVKDHRGTKKWGLDDPLTVVTATVTCFVAADRVVVFLADEDDRQRVQRLAPLDQEIPF